MNRKCTLSMMRNISLPKGDALIKHTLETEERRIKKYLAAKMAERMISGREYTMRVDVERDIGAIQVNLKCAGLVKERDDTRD